jgi:flagella basal body P-ring formation protein FlgA
MRALAAFLTALAFAAPARAEPATLKPLVTVSSEIVRIGDLIDNAGPNAEVPVFRSPDLGHTGLVSTARILEAVRAHAVTEVETNGLAEVAVTRASRSFGVKEIEAHVLRAAEARLGHKDGLAVTFDRDVRTMHFEPTAGDLQVVRFNYDPRSSRFDVAFDLPDAASRRRQPLRFSGSIIETVEVAVLAGALNRGVTIKASDVTLERRPMGDVAGVVLAGADQVIGMAVRRPMRPGQLVRQADLMKPELVARNETVTLIYEVPGITLTMRGRAMESGAEGDLINVVNLQSKRTIQGTVSGQGRVTVAAPAARITTASADPSRAH